MAEGRASGITPLAMWPGVAVCNRKVNRRIGTEDQSAKRETCSVGPETFGYVTSRVGRGTQSINCSTGNRERRANVGWSVWRRNPTVGKQSEVSYPRRQVRSEENKFEEKEV